MESAFATPRLAPCGSACSNLKVTVSGAEQPADVVAAKHLWLRRRLLQLREIYDAAASSR